MSNESETTSIILRRCLGDERIDKQSIRYKVYKAMEEYADSVRESEHGKIKRQLSPGSVRKYWTTDEVHEKINQVRKEEKKAAQEYSSLQIRKVIETIQDFETGLLDEDFEGKTLIEIIKMKFE